MQQPPETLIQDSTRQRKVLEACEGNWRRTGEIAACVDGLDSAEAGTALRHLDRKGLVSRRGRDSRPEWKVSALGMCALERAARKEDLGDSDG